MSERTADEVVRDQWPLGSREAPESARTIGPGDVTEYVAAQSADMARMARRADLPRLALLLEIVQREADSAVAR